jgi:hypothetical protein
MSDPVNAPAKSETPRVDCDTREYPRPEYIEHIVFEGRDCVVLSPEGYDELYEKARTLETELTIRDKTIADLWSKLAVSDQALRVAKSLAETYKAKLDAANEARWELRGEIQRLKGVIDELYEKEERG